MSVIKTLQISLKYVVLTIAVIIGAVYYQHIITKSSNNIDVLKKRVFSLSDLSTYDGVQQEKLYLAVLGNVFDVTVGSQHYRKGSSYHYFVGKDGTRALVTGNFKDESNEKDHVLQLSCNEILTILDWRKTYKEKYTYVGVLAGRYYDEKGADTSYMTELKQKVAVCRSEKKAAKLQDQLFPPCNMAWSEEDGSKVWCTKSSGGIVRDWVGVPRQMFTPGQDKPLCVCASLDKINSSQLKEYKHCSKTASECFVKDNNN
ncbi:neuferricin [Bicyclus anynana]|uniref:Neuferricin n=1 Tax=Bicyclus anynana TaxID=110368 RepID=A0A6J1NPR2_BICAN|nr:neuferricin [Bicyclus anynana]